MLQILLAMKGIDEFTVFTLSYRIDGQVTALQVFLQAYPGMKINAETVVTVALLFLGTGQCIFLTVFRVQENGKGRAHLFEAPVQHFIGRTADHDPVPLSGIYPQKGITYGPSNQVGPARAQGRGCRRRHFCRRF